MRIFVALDPGPLAQACCASLRDELTPTAPRSRWVDSGAIHLTLVFLGEVDEDRIDPIEVALSAAAAACPAIDLGIGGGGAFGSRRSPRILWLGLHGDLEPLHRLHAEITRALVPLGFTPDARPYSPHLTLARARDSRGDPDLVRARDRLVAISTTPEPIRELVLYRSRLGPRGARYEVVAAFPIGSADRRNDLPR